MLPVTHVTYCCTTVHGFFSVGASDARCRQSLPRHCCVLLWRLWGFQKAPVVLTHETDLVRPCHPALALQGLYDLCLAAWPCADVVLCCVSRDVSPQFDSLFGDQSRGQNLPSVLCRPWVQVGRWWCPVCFFKVQDYCVRAHASLSSFCAPHSSRLPANSVCVCELTRGACASAA